MITWPTWHIYLIGRRACYSRTTQSSKPGTGRRARLLPRHVQRHPVWRGTSRDWTAEYSWTTSSNMFVLSSSRNILLNRWWIQHADQVTTPRHLENIHAGDLLDRRTVSWSIKSCGTWNWCLTIVKVPTSMRFLVSVVIRFWRKRREPLMKSSMQSKQERHRGLTFVYFVCFKNGVIWCLRCFS